MDLLSVLRGVGIDGHKADFYLASLELGEATVAAIAHKAGIGRTNAYEVMDRLIAAGLISTIERGARSFVIPQDPIVLLRHLDEQRRAVQDVLPELRSIHNSSGRKPKVRFFAGEEGIKAVLNETLDCQSKEMRGILSMSDLLQTPGEAVMNEMIARRAKADISLRVVRSGSKDVKDSWPTSRRERRVLRYAPPHLEFGMSAYLYDDTVALISSKVEHYALSIQSADFFSFQCLLFESLWESCGPDSPMR